MGTFKHELVYLHVPWPTKVQLEWGIIEWTSRYKRARLHTGIGDVPPAEYEADWYCQHRPVPTAETK